MKKFILLSLLALAVLGLGVYSVFRQKAFQIHAPALVGEETLIFIHCPDIHQSRARWKATALHQIAHDPDVLAFLQKPKTQLSLITGGTASGSASSGNVRSYLRDFNLADPREAFFALNSISKTPTFVAGALFMGDKAKVESELAEIQKELQKAWPEAKKSLVQHSGVNIETFTNSSGMLACAWVGRWVLIGDDVELIKTTIDRAQKSGSRGLLKDSLKYQKSLAHMPANGEFTAFIQPQGIAQGLLALGSSTGHIIPDTSLEDLKKLEALCIGVKFDGENVRDAFFALMNPTTQSPALSGQCLKFTTKDTLLYFTGIMDLKKAADRMAKLPNDPSSLPPILAVLQASLASQGITVASLAEMLGNEYSVTLDWPAAAMQPSLLISLDVRDTAKTTKAVDLLTNGQLGNPAWKHTQIDGAEVFSISPLPMVAPTVAIKADKLVFGLESSAVTAALTTANQPHEGLKESQLFKDTEKLVIKPTHSFGYVDSKALFERIYGVSRPLIMLWGGFSPAVRNTIDVHKLPPTEAISKHLKPIVYSSSSLPDGFLSESVGPVTMTQTLFLAGIGAGAALIPMAKSYMAPAGPQSVSSSPSLPTGGQPSAPEKPAEAPSPSAQPTPVAPN